jgi:enamine deaminase RidA (YjgF/YER057c/UK114 family)
MVVVDAGRGNRSGSEQRKETDMSNTNRRRFFRTGVAAAAVATAAAAPAAAQEAPTKKVIGGNPNAARPPLFSGAVSYGNLLFIAGIGAHVPGDIKSHTKIVLDGIKAQLEKAGSSMDKVLKCNVYLADLKDYADMNTVYQGAFGAQPPVRTTIAAAGVPGNSLVEIDVIAYI